MITRVAVLVILSAVLVVPTSNADCMQCDTYTQDCINASPGLSGNCGCIITVRPNYKICKPDGICDPNDPNTCSDKDRKVKSFDPTQTAFMVKDRAVGYLWRQHPLLGMTMEILSLDGEVFLGGEHKAAVRMSRDAMRIPGRGDEPQRPVVKSIEVSENLLFSIWIDVFSPESLRFRADVENVDTAELIQISGDFYNFGFAGSASIITNGIETDRLDWARSYEE